MKSVILGLALVTGAIGAARADNLEVCHTRHVELTSKVSEFKGEPRMKRLIEADLRRALKEAADGDAEECIEALDHAAKLLAGDL